MSDKNSVNKGLIALHGFMVVFLSLIAGVLFAAGIISSKLGIIPDAVVGFDGSAFILLSVINLIREGPSVLQ